MKTFIELLFEHQDEKYGDFSAKLIPNVPRKMIIGVRSPEFKKIIKEINRTPEFDCQIDAFLNDLPHKFHEENLLHVCFINSIKDFDKCVFEIEKFLPYINNWAVSDSLSPKIFEKNHQKIIKKIEEWILDENPYSKRVAMLFIKKYFLDDDFSERYLQLTCKIRSDEYYVNMMTAWLFADALVKQWNCAVSFLQEKKLDVWTHNKAIQKACESFRITPEKKEYLKTLKIR